MRQNVGQTTILPSLPSCDSFKSKPQACIEDIRHRIEMKMQALFACGCHHELTLATRNPRLSVMADDILCSRSIRSANPGCAHATKTLQPDPFFYEVELLVKLGLLDQEWVNVTTSLTHRIANFDARISLLAKTGRPILLSNLQTDQQPIIEAVRECGKALIEVLVAHENYVQSTGSFAVGTKLPNRLMHTYA